MGLVSSMHAKAGSLALGDRKVVLGSSIGRGSLGTVYRATLESTLGVRRLVACKVLSTLATDEYEPVVEQLAEIVRRAVCLRHPNVAEVFELSAAVATRQPFVLSELVDGASLRRLLDVLARRGRRVPLDLALFIGIEIAEGLNGARIARGADGRPLAAAHLDVSARDVLLSWQGAVKVTDFGMNGARQVASNVRSLSHVARRADTMAPEVARGTGGDSRSDVFSLGVLLHEMLVGPRFASGIGDGEALKFAREGFMPPVTFEPHLPEDVKKIVDRALEPSPERRFPHTGALAYELRRVAFCLGVGDSRFFLKSLLESELADERSDATAPGDVRKRKTKR
jgi:eukaryotic-like serine/threonine-protein kinase